jgi:hypothetical protein
MCSTKITFNALDDDKMGRDSVVECVKESGTIKAYTSWTIVGPGKYDSPRTGIVSSMTFSRLINFFLTFLTLHN